MRRLFSELLYLGAWAAALASAFWVAVELAGYAPPPLRPETPVGSGFRVERGGQHILHLSGDSYALGFHNSRLTGHLMTAQENMLLDLLFGFAGGPGRALLIHQMSLFYLAGLDAYLNDAERQEILGLASGHVDPFPELGPRYGRIVAYHAIHELSQRFAVDSPGVACSLVAVSSARGQDNHAYLARNFDFEGGDVFDEDKIVLAVRPTEGYGFVSVAWAGMVGVVSGINEQGLAITINAGASQQWRRVGTPTTLLVRRALQRARTIDEAVVVLTEQPRFVTDIMGLADRTGRVAVLELTPEEARLREGDVLVATNHLETPELANDPVSVARQKTTTTLPRHARLGKLVRQQSGAIGPRELLHMLRDRSRADGISLPLAHRHAVDALIATHSLIFDATAARLWVSEGPHTLGPYHGYDVAALVAATGARDVEAAYLPSMPADELLAAYPLIRQARAALGRAAAALDAGDAKAAKRQLSHTVSLADHPKTLVLRARLAEARGEEDWARRYLMQALETPPEYPVATARTEERLDMLNGVRGR